MNYISDLDLKNRMLVTEAMNVTANIESIRSKLGAVASSITGFVMERVKPQAAMPLVNYASALRDIRKVRYTDVYQGRLTVPRGLKVTLPEYVESLVPMVAFAEVLQQDVLVPFNTWLALRIAAPESLADASTVTDLRKFKEHNLEPFRASLQETVDPVSRRDHLPLSKVFPNLNSIQPCWNDVNSLVSRYLSTSPVKLVKQVEEIAKKVKRLVEIIQENDAVRPNQQTITILSSICWKMAEEVDFYGVLGAQLRELSVACNLQANELKTYIKRAVDNNKRNGTVVTESLVDAPEPGLEIGGKWFSETDLKFMAMNHAQQDVTIDALAWVLEYTRTAPLPDAGFEANAHVTAIRWGDMLYPVMGLEYLATLKAAGESRISVVILDKADLFPGNQL